MARGIQSLCRHSHLTAQCQWGLPHTNTAVSPHVSLYGIRISVLNAQNVLWYVLTQPSAGSIQDYPEDCLGCSSCSIICPGHALTMTPIDEVLPTELPMLEWVKDSVSLKRDLISAYTVNGSQLQPPYLEFSGACAGCGETPYVKLLTQLFGSDMIIANATGCSSIHFLRTMPNTAMVCLSR